MKKQRISPHKDSESENSDSDDDNIEKETNHPKKGTRQIRDKKIKSSTRHSLSDEERSPRKKAKTHRDSSGNHSSSDEKDSLPEKNRAAKALSKRDQGDKKVKSLAKSNDVKTSGTVNPEKAKTTSREKSELNKTSNSKVKKPEHSPSKHDKASTSRSKENDSAVENDKNNAPESDFERKKTVRSSPKKLLSSSNEASSAEENNSSTKGDKNVTVSDSGVKKHARGRPQKSESLAVGEKNSGLESTKAETPIKRKKGDTQKNSKKVVEAGKHSDSKKSSRAHKQGDGGEVSDKRPKNTDETNSTVTNEDIDNTSSDDSSDSQSESSRVPIAKKLKREYSCHKCSDKFTRTQELFDHICEGKQKKGFACERCDKIFKLRSSYVNHKIIHSRKKPYKCGRCGKKSSSQSNHLLHMKNHHPEIKPFPCEYSPCNKSYMTRREQTAHHKKHKLLICTYCYESFDKYSTLKRHKYRIHEIYFK